MISIEDTKLPGVLVITPKRFEDPRGFLSEVWNKDTLAQHGIHLDFVQDNHSLSREQGVLRGLHFQSPPHAQDKLVRVSAGAILDVAVDFRKGSPTFGQWTAVELTAQNGKQILIPKGCLHGFVTRQPNTEVLYKSTRTYAPDFDRAIYFADPDLAIDWGIDPERAIVSDKDKNAPAFRNLDSPFVYRA